MQAARNLARQLSQERTLSGSLSGKFYVEVSPIIRYWPCCISWVNVVFTESEGKYEDTPKVSVNHGVPIPTGYSRDQAIQGEKAFFMVCFTHTHEYTHARMMRAIVAYV